jgi:hypothetical protein
MMNVTPEKEHEWLHRLVGEWSFEIEPAASAGGPPDKAKGREVVRSLGGLWIVGEGEGEMPGGGPARTIITLGYDPQTKRFSGTWIGSMMTHLWIYDGGLDSAGRVLTLDSQGPSMAGDGSSANYQDIIELQSDDHRILRARVLDKEGRWQPLMTVHYRRG